MRNSRTATGRPKTLEAADLIRMARANQIRKPTAAQQQGPQPRQLRRPTHRGRMAEDKRTQIRPNNAAAEATAHAIPMGQFNRTIKQAAVHPWSMHRRRMATSLVRAWRNVAIAPPYRKRAKPRNRTPR